MLVKGVPGASFNQRRNPQNTPYLEHCGVFYEYLWEHWPRYNDTALYMQLRVESAKVSAQRAQVNNTHMDTGSTLQWQLTSLHSVL